MSVLEHVPLHTSLRECFNKSSVITTTASRPKRAGGQSYASRHGRGYGTAAPRTAGLRTRSQRTSPMTEVLTAPAALLVWLGVRHRRRRLTQGSSHQKTRGTGQSGSSGAMTGRLSHSTTPVPSALFSSDDLR